MPEETERWSWLKLLKGPLTGVNYGKAITLTLCQLIIGSILLCVYLVVRNHFADRPLPTDTSTISGQTVTQNIDKSARTVTQTNMPFANGLFGWCNKVEGKEK